jgi:hypothetical protein
METIKLVDYLKVNRRKKLQTIYGCAVFSQYFTGGIGWLNSIRKERNTNRYFLFCSQIKSEKQSTLGMAHGFDVKIDDDGSISIHHSVKKNN